MTATTSIPLPKSVPTDLTIKSDPYLTNPRGKDGVRDWSIGQCNKISTPISHKIKATRQIAQYLTK